LNPTRFQGAQAPHATLLAAFMQEKVRPAKVDPDRGRTPNITSSADAALGDARGPSSARRVKRQLARRGDCTSYVPLATFERGVTGQGRVLPTVPDAHVELTCLGI